MQQQQQQQQQLLGPDPAVIEAIEKRGNVVTFFDIAVGGTSNNNSTSNTSSDTNNGTYIGRIKLELFVNECPKTVENFRQFCTGEYINTTTNESMGYKNSIFHRVIKDFMIQGGDFINNNGTGSICIYNNLTTFPDENFIYKHNQPGMLSCANNGPNTNGCQFFITTTANASWLDNKHCVFGRVLDSSSMLTVRKIENTPVSNGTEPRITIRIIECGEL
jgi:peptidyl-prolyl isomerase H (cyclophilin H)